MMLDIRSEEISHLKMITHYGSKSSLNKSYCLSYDLASCLVYKLQYGKCNSSYCSETDKLLKLRSGEQNSIYPLTLNKV